MRPDRPRGLATRPTLIGLWSLGLILYFVVTYAFVVPFSTVSLEWRPGGEAVVASAMPALTPENPNGPTIEVGDVLAAIDGIPLRNSGLQFRFGPRGPTHTYDFLRGQERFTVELPAGSPSVLERLNLLLPGLVALEAWLLGFLILLLAPATHRDAGLVGVVMLGFGVALAAAPAAGYEVPGARLAYEVLAPIMSVGYLEMSLLPRRTGESTPRLLRLLYVLAALLAALALVEVFILNPATAWQFLVGIRLEALVLAALGLAILASPIVMAVRARREPSAYTRRQIEILLVGTGLALLPFILLTALPRAFTGQTLLPLEFTLPLLGAIPASYAYVIFRQRYLRLDLVAARSLMILLVVLLAVIFFFGGYRAAYAIPATAELAPFLGVACLFLGVFVAQRANERLRPTIDLLLYGPKRHFDQVLNDLTSALLAEPTTETLRTILLESIASALEVRVAALLLPDEHQQFAPTGVLGDPLLPSLPTRVAADLPGYVLSQGQDEAPLAAVPWAKLIVPLKIRGRTTGLLLLGGKATDAFFDAVEVDFVERLAPTVAVAVENVRLFEAQQAMAQERLRVRSTERMELAYRLHDEPLQRVHDIARGLETLSAALPAEQTATELLAVQRESLRALARELRDITAGLRPPILNQGLVATMRAVAAAFTERYPDLHIETAIGLDDEPILSDEALDAIYHVVTEALNNVGKHAHADSVMIAVEGLGAVLRITVTDNGIGADLGRLHLADLARGHHYGLAGMHEWARVAGGSLHVRAAATRGTVIELKLPLEGSNGA
jgi:signal transduction histidine kinase